MQHDIPTYTEKEIRSAFRICKDLGKITEEQENYLISIMNFPFKQSQCDKRNRKPFWERFASDLAAVLEEYGCFIHLGFTNAQITFMNAVEHNWNMTVENYLDAGEVLKWPAIYKLQKKANAEFLKLPKEEQTIELHQRLMAKARKEAGNKPTKNQNQK